MKRPWIALTGTVVGAAVLGATAAALIVPAPAPQAPEPTTSTTSAWPATPTSTPVPEVPGDGTFPAIEDVDRTDVDSTARTTAVLLHSWDTALDRTETAAAIRAKPLMSDEWADTQIEPERNASQGDWLEPSEHRAYSRAQAVPSIGDVSQDVAADKAIRAYTVTWRWASRDGEPAEGTGRRHVVIYLEKHAGVWEVVGHRSSDMGATDAEGQS